MNRITKEDDLAFQNRISKLKNPFVLPNAHKEDLELATYWHRGHISAEKKTIATTRNE